MTQCTRAVSCHRIKLEIPVDQEDLSPDNFELCRNIAANDTCESMGWVRRVEPRRVWDAFPFFNEVRVLKLRLHTLAPVMHRFVLAEATRTFSNESKPLHFGERVRDDAELAYFLPQIEHVVIDNMPTASHWPFDREHHQRNALVRGLAQAEEDDLILVSDCDEIPDPHAIELLRSCDGWDTTGPVRFYIRHYQWKFSFQFQTLKPHPQLATVEWLAGARARGQLQHLRYASSMPSHLRLHNAWWHLSFFADAEGVMRKMQAYAHHQDFAQSGIYNSSDDAAVARMRDAIANGSDCVGNTCLYQPGVVGALVDVSEALTSGDKCMRACARAHTHMTHDIHRSMASAPQFTQALCMDVF